MSQILKDVGEDIIISVSEKEMSLTCTGGSLDACVKLSEQTGAQIICKAGSTVDLAFKFKYIELLSKSAHLARAEEVLLQLDNEKPLSLVFELGLGSLNFYLAPLIEE
eukprot:TRINITY_DN673_c0_g1_i7.p2 TRINITY_DN673_c0_g1~~TRINITY_DN673_c0_g1_i7.p2  ORF type:complete len:108 (-),score=21.67 TRINITY_DN673_c0_g1_i7:335-658(-)